MIDGLLMAIGYRVVCGGRSMALFDGMSRFPGLPIHSVVLRITSEVNRKTFR